jgi:hypothetical protein
MQEGMSQLRKWKHRQSVRVSTHVPPKKTQARLQRTFFPGASLYLPRGADLQGKGKQRRLGEGRSVGPADKVGSMEGKRKRIAHALGELGARLQGGPQRSRQTDEGRGRTGTA